MAQIHKQTRIEGRGYVLKMKKNEKKELQAQVVDKNIIKPLQLSPCTFQLYKFTCCGVIYTPVSEE